MSDASKKPHEAVRNTLELIRSLMVPLSPEHRALVMIGLTETHAEFLEVRRRLEQKEHCPRRLMGEQLEPHVPCDTGDFSKDKTCECGRPARENSNFCSSECRQASEKST